MKITIHTDGPDELAIDISCAGMTPELEKIISLLRMIDLQIMGKKDDETYIIPAEKIYYIDTVEKHTFLYTDCDVYESSLRLWELEEQLARVGFIRAGKSCIINIRKIKSLKADIDRRIRVKMQNGEEIVVSRQYADSLKARLEGK